MLGLAAAAVAVVIGLAVAAGGSGDEGAAPGTTATTIDLASVTDAQLEQVVAEHPEVVGMRLALVERYLRAGQLEDAQRHAEEAAVRADNVQDRARGLRYLGWTTALLGDPEQGEGILVESLALDPSNRDALYFLGRVRFEQLGRPDLALAPLEQLSAMDMGTDQRQLVDTLLAEVRVALSATTTSVP